MSLFIALLNFLFCFINSEKHRRASQVQCQLEIIIGVGEERQGARAPLPPFESYPGNFGTYSGKFENIRAT